MKYFIFVLSFFALFSCHKKEESNQYLTQAHEIYNKFPMDSIKVNESLNLLEKSLELYPNNVNALILKSTILFQKKDIQGIIEISDKLIELDPQNPNFFYRKAFYLDISGNNSEAQKYYQYAIEIYRSLIDPANPNFDLMLEYLICLDDSGDTLKYNQTVKEIYQMGFDKSQIEIFEMYINQPKIKDQVIKFWTGKINFDQIGNYGNY